METEPFGSLMRKVLDAYNRHPEGWNVLVDPKGNVLILSREGGYRLRLVPLNPYEYTGVGVTIEVDEELRGSVTGAPSYGFRPVPSTVLRKLVHTAGRGALSRALVAQLLTIKPQPSWRVRETDAKAVLRGPIIAHPDLGAISKGQRALDAKLASAGNALFRRRYPERAAFYT